MVSAILVTALMFLVVAGYATFADARARKLHPPTGKFIDVDGAKLHYTDTGTGPCIVLLHGNGGAWGDMEACTLISKLSQSYRVLAFDRPGFGHSERCASRSMAPEAQALAIITAIKEISNTPTVIVGHSYGALVAVACGLEAPKNIQGLVLVSGYLMPAYPKLALLRHMATPIFAPFAQYFLIPIIARLVSPIVTSIAFHPRKAASAFRKEMPWPLLFRSDQLMISLEELAEMHSSAQRIDQKICTLRLPTILLAGTEDKIVDTKAHTCAFHQKSCQSRMQLVPGVGHMFHYARPDLVCAEVEGLWRQAHGRDD